MLASLPRWAPSASRLSQLVSTALGRTLSTTADAAGANASKVSGFVWGPLKQRGGKEWIVDQAAPKRGRKLVAQLVQEERGRLTGSEPWRTCAHFRSGDAVSVRYVYSKTQTKENVFRGVCVGTKSNGLAAGFWVRNVVAGEEVLAFFKAYSPLVKGVDVVKEQLLKARRNKLTYLKGNLAKFIKRSALTKM